MCRNVHCKPHLFCYWIEKAVRSSLNVFCILDFEFLCLQISWGLQAAGPLVSLWYSHFNTRSLWLLKTAELSTRLSCVPENTATVMFSSRAVWSVSFSLRMLVNATYYCFIETDMSANVEQLVTLSGDCTPAEGGDGYITAVITKAVVCSCNVLKKQWFCVVELLLHGIFLYAKCFISVSTFNIMHKMHCGRSCREVVRLPQQ